MTANTMLQIYRYRNNHIKELRRLLLLIFLYFGSLQTVIACDCAIHGSPRAELEIHDAVFSGKVIRIHGHFTNKVEVQPFEIFKGKVSHPVVLHGYGECSMDFQADEDYLIYAYKNEAGELVSIHCSRTKKLALADEEIAELKRLIAGKDKQVRIVIFPTVRGSEEQRLQIYHLLTSTLRKQGYKVFTPQDISSEFIKT